MQADSITIPVDAANSGTTTDEIYTRVDYVSGRSEYHGPNFEMDAREKLNFYRTLPKVNGNYKGSAKTSFKFTKDREVTSVDGSTISAPSIIEVSFSFPVGMTDAQMTEDRQRALALLDMDSVMDALHEHQRV